MADRVGLWVAEVGYSYFQLVGLGGVGDTEYIERQGATANQQQGEKP